MYKLLLAIFLLQYFPSAAFPSDTIPRGVIKGPFQWRSNIYTGTVRNYWIYVPAQYVASQTACLMVVQDGLSRANGWRLPVVLDSLINSKDIPVMIGLFIDPGTVPAADTNALPRFNRSLEYDALGSKYSSFLLQELIPHVRKSYNLSNDPNDWSIAGASSGAICAFNVAWERPDAFRRVFSSIGTYVGLRGGNEFVTLVRKTEAKPLRIFLQDGTKDNNIYAGDWWVANQDMLSALTWAGYEVNHAWGEGGGHDSRHTLSILPNALKWLWQDYPVKVRTHSDSISRINPLVAGEDWQEVNLRNVKPGFLAVNESGDLYLNDKNLIHKYDGSGKITSIATMPTGTIGGLSFGSNGRLYVSHREQRRIYSITEQGGHQLVAENVDATFLAVTSKGIYFSDQKNKRIGFLNFSGKQVTYSTVPGVPAGLSISGEQTFISVGFRDLPLGYSFKIMADGTLANGQEYIHYHIPYGQTAPSITGMATDTSNLLYSGTSMGIQMSDQLGRINLIISKPAGTIKDLKIGGANLDTLYVSCGGKLFTRRLHTKAVLPWLLPVKSPRPRL